MSSYSSLLNYTQNVGDHGHFGRHLGIASGSPEVAIATVDIKSPVFLSEGLYIGIAENYTQIPF